MKTYINGIEISINLNSKFENFKSFFFYSSKAKKCKSFSKFASKYNLNVFKGFGVLEHFYISGTKQRASRCVIQGIAKSCKHPRFCSIFSYTELIITWLYRITNAHNSIFY